MNGDEETMVYGSTTSDLFTHTFYYGSEDDDDYRNYTVCYDSNALTTYWVAYPLNSSYFGSVARTEEWAYVDSSLLEESKQVNVKSSFYDSNNVNNFSRGHLVPSGSRNASEKMNEQTFLSVNIAPQIQSGFNGSIWNALENALQAQAKSNSLFVVTGTMCPQANDGNGSFSMEETYDDKSGKQIPAPRYFYKVVLKVDNEENPTSASAIGFWYTNQSHTGNFYDAAYVKSVDQIEELTGLDFFVNLPDTLENSVETNTSWSNF